MDISKSHALQAIEMCLTNAQNYLDDANALYSQRKLEHIWVSYQFAFEELGKAKAMIDQLEQNTIPVKMNNAIRTKHQIKIDYIKDLIKITPEREKYYHDTWSNFPLFNMFGDIEKTKNSFVALDQEIVNQLVTDGHEKRKRAFVNFKPDGTPHLDDKMREGDCVIISEIIQKIIEDLRIKSSKIN